MKPKIIFVTGSLEQGGAERVISILSNKLLINYDVSIVCYYNRPHFFTIAPEVNIYNLEKNSSYNNVFSKAVCLRKFLLSQKNCVVVAFMLPYYVFTVLSLLGTKIKIVASERTDPRRHSFFRKILSRLCLYRVKALIVQTETAKSYYPLNIQVKTTVIYNPLSDDIKSIFYKSNTGNVNIVTMSRFVKDKNLQLLIHAFRNLCDSFNNITLTMYGNGPLKDELQKLVRHLNLQDCVFFPGYTLNASEALSEADIYVCSSNYEGLPNSLIEAMSCGIPSVSTRVAGAVDLIADGVNGLLVDIDDLNALTVQLSLLCSNDSLRTKLGKEASKIRELVNPNLITKQWDQLLNNVL